MINYFDSVVTEDTCVASNKPTALLTYFMLHLQSHFQDLLHEEQEVKSAEYPDGIRHVVISFGIKPQSL